MSEPSARLYKQTPWTRLIAPRQIMEREAWTNFDPDEWTETPLYTREAIEAEIVAWLREMKRADTNWPQVIAGKIERGEYRSKSDG